MIACENSLPPEDPPIKKQPKLATSNKNQSPNTHHLRIQTRGSLPRVKFRFLSSPGQQHLYRTRVKLTHTRGTQKSSAHFKALAMLEDKGKTKDGHVLELSFPHLEKYSPGVGRSVISGILSKWRQAYVINEEGVVTRMARGHKTAPKGLPAPTPLLEPTAHWPKVSLGKGAQWSFVTRKQTSLKDRMVTEKAVLVVDTSYHLSKLYPKGPHTRALIITKTNVRIERIRGGSYGRGSGKGEVLFEVDTGRVLTVESHLGLEIDSKRFGVETSHEEAIFLKRVVPRRSVEIHLKE